jgi:hypothetical protein
LISKMSRFLLQSLQPLAFALAHGPARFATMLVGVMLSAGVLLTDSHLAMSACLATLAMLLIVRETPALLRLEAAVVSDDDEQ